MKLYFCQIEKIWEEDFCGFKGIMAYLWRHNKDMTGGMCLITWHCYDLCINER